ncbi:TPA: translation initiation factor eIF-1A [Candidatus Micrarchaeota archaeon]|nr:translation initiation factor eIF-1A [Candidatus Micrarchaeota archaeon]HIH30570.1 translation initiation factor eIF-1A [Candidatus Micrarchaeota archaeon]
MADEAPPAEQPMGWVRLPKEGEILGVVIGTLGGGRLMVQCKDGKERMCRIPGKIRRNIWVRDNDIVIVIPWEIGGDKKADVVWRYNKFQAEMLRRQGHIK